MITILSPAKKLDEKSIGHTGNYSHPELIDDSRILVDILREFSPENIKALMNVSKEIAELNFERYARWEPPFNEDNAKQAILMFNGQVYQGLDAKRFTEEDFNFSQHHLRILSGLYGILRPLDLIQPYRLEMGTKLSNPRGKNLYEFWGKKITEKINEALKGHTNNYLINLASDEYYKSVDKSLIDGEIITPSFREKKGKDYKTIAIYAKKARGLMTQYIVKNRIEDPEHLKGFEEEGYSFNPHLSNENNWVFTR
jgi:cytoplasmic iron level regulating protein YaaA (DUF328/UPF0246 family)